MEELGQNCDEWIEVGIEMGWVNPEPEDFATLFDVPQDMIEAGVAVADRCE